jgi:probable DNA metabolism protein
MILLYDGSFEGFLSLVYKVYYKRLQPNEIYKILPNKILFEEIIEIETSKENSTKVLNAIKKNFNKQSLQKILNIFMCDTKNFELDLLSFIIIGFKDKNELFNINNSYVFSLNTLEKELFRLVHKMYAYARFEELEDGTLYAKIDSKFNVIYFLAKHFMKRFNNQKFIIHDVKRKLAFIKTNDFIGVQEVASFEVPTYSQNEEKFQKLWKSFFNAVSIKERENLKLQQNQVPLLYRTYMSEFFNEPTKK